MTAIVEYLYENVVDGRRVWAKNRKELMKLEGISRGRCRNLWGTNTWRLANGVVVSFANYE